jgi:gluconolactonase
MRVPLIVAFIFLPQVVTAQKPTALDKPVRTVDSIPGPESVVVGPDGTWYVSAFGKFDNGNDGTVYRVDPDKGTKEIYARGLEDPCGVLFVGNTLWAADRKGVYRITGGKAELVYPARSFPRPLHFLNDLAAGPDGTMYVSDTGDSTSSGHGAVFVLRPGGKISVLAGSDTARALSSVNGIFQGSGDTVYVVGYRTGVLSAGHRGSWRELAHNLGSPDGIDAAARGTGWYVSDNVGGDLFLVSPGGHATKLASGLKAPADLVVDRKRGWLVVPENDANRLSVYAVGRSDGGTVGR